MALSRRALLLGSVLGPVPKPAVLSVHLHASRLNKNFADVVVNRLPDAFGYARALVDAHKELSRMVASSQQAPSPDLTAMHDQLVVYEAMLDEMWPDSPRDVHAHQA
jgi:hypothetical protein